MKSEECFCSKILCESCPRSESRKILWPERSERKKGERFGKERKKVWDRYVHCSARQTYKWKYKKEREMIRYFSSLDTHHHP